MKYCVDTWFLLKIGEKDQKAIQLMREVITGKDWLFIPTPCIAETVRKHLKLGKNKREAELLFEALQNTDKVVDVNIDRGIAFKSALLSATYDLPTIDSFVAASCIEMQCDVLLSADAHYKPLEKKGLLKVKSW